MKTQYWYYDNQTDYNVGFDIFDPLGNKIAGVNSRDEAERLVIHLNRAPL